MKNVTHVRTNLTLILLASGVCCFGLILPDSFSDHDKLVHFSAHFGMSFLLALCSYMICTLKIRISKPLSYFIIIAVTLCIGVFYKFWEITTEGMLERFDFFRAIEITGFMKSMSQNIAGLMAAVLLIEGLVDRNLVISALRSDNLYTGPGSTQAINPENLVNGINLRHQRGGAFPTHAQFSPESSENSFG
jgi:hypothetical protein